jgi:hypothetical protein
VAGLADALDLGLLTKYPIINQIRYHCEGNYDKLLPWVSISETEALGCGCPTRSKANSTESLPAPLIKTKSQGYSPHELPQLESRIDASSERCWMILSPITGEWQISPVV